VTAVDGSEGDAEVGIGDSSRAKLFERLTVMFQDLLSRIESVTDHRRNWPGRDRPHRGARHERGAKGLRPTRFRPQALRTVVLAAGLVLAVLPATSHASTLDWMGHAWTSTNGAMAGVAPGRPSNVQVNARGYLRLMITKTKRGVTAGELFSNDNMGFGTYQWQIQGPVDNMDPHAVLGLFPYGPAGGIGVDGENEIDIEFSKWSNSLCGGACNADFTVYPSTGNRSVEPTEDDFAVNRADLVTARITWTSTSITETVMAGLQPLGSTRAVILTWTFAPADYLVRIPQQPVPVGMNLWCYKKTVASSQAVVIRSFEYVAQ